MTARSEVLALDRAPPNKRLKLSGLLFKGIGRSLAGVRRLRARPSCAGGHVARSLSAIR